MDAIRLSSSGLQTLAMQYASSASDTAGGVPTSTSVASGQATSAAVTTANALVGTTANVLATQLSTTGTKISTVGTTMTEQDQESAQQLTTLRPTVSW